MVASVRSVDEAQGQKKPVAWWRTDTLGDWHEVQKQFLTAVSPGQRSAVALQLHQTLQTGAGLRLWLQALAWGRTTLPAVIPPELIGVYLRDPEALPLHTCADCGLAIPVRPARETDWEAEPEGIYFPRCPACGGRTGWHLFHSKPLAEA